MPFNAGGGTGFPAAFHGQVREEDRPDLGPFRPCCLESLTSPESRKNIQKILPETPRLESPDESGHDANDPANVV
jgi:hypothetical protein